MNTQTPEDRARLRDLASRATPGPWVKTSRDGQPYIHPPATGAIVVNYAPIEQRHADGCYIAAVDPATVTALLDALDAAEATVQRVRALAAEWDRLHVEHRHHTLHPWTAADRLRGALGTASPCTCSMCGEPITGLHIVDGCTAARALDGDA